MPHLKPDPDDESMVYPEAPSGAAGGFAETLAEQAFVLNNQAGAFFNLSFPDGQALGPAFSLESGTMEDVLKIARRAANAVAARGDEIDDVLAQIRTLQAKIAA